MLNELRIYAVLPATDIERAKQFYRDKLGLEPAKEAAGEVVYECADGTSFNLYETPNAGTAQNTAMGWTVSDLEGTMATLKDNGVMFEKYDMPGVDPETGIATEGDKRAVWFKDTEGNILCLST
jgi:catechol 2,3-dioxygenase-like lactoylglutathione lyase family enzyme